MEKTTMSRAEAADPARLAVETGGSEIRLSARVATRGSARRHSPVAPAVSVTPVVSPGGVPAVSLGYIFLTFLKLGAMAFGGYMSLVAMVQKQLVEIDRRLKEETLLDAVSLTSVLPGPVAVNVIVYIGYRLRGVAGAAVAFAGIILPSFLLVTALSRLYFSYGDIPAVQSLFRGITPAVTALILTVALGMARKTMKTPAQWAIGAVSSLLLAAIGGFALTFGLIVASGIAGYRLFRPSTSIPSGSAATSGSPSVLGTDTGREQGAEHKAGCKGERKAGRRGEQGAMHGRARKLPSGKSVFLGVVVVGLILCFVFWSSRKGEPPLAMQILSVFAGCSLTLFGGGYVVIPALHELFVENLHWLTASEFADGIAVGQVTPGPIFITATFIGYKVAGWSGAFYATLAMFAPPAALTVLASRFMKRLDDSTAVKAAMKGVRAAVIGLIFASAFTIGQTMDRTVPGVVLFVLCLAVSWKYAVSPVYLILGAAVAGFCFF